MPGIEKKESKLEEIQDTPQVQPLIQKKGKPMITITDMAFKTDSPQETTELIKYSVLKLFELGKTWRGMKEPVLQKWRNHQ